MQAISAILANQIQFARIIIYCTFPMRKSVIIHNLLFPLLMNGQIISNHYFRLWSRGLNKHYHFCCILANPVTFYIADCSIREYQHIIAVSPKTLKFGITKISKLIWCLTIKLLPYKLSKNVNTLCVGINKRLKSNY